MKRTTPPRIAASLRVLLLAALAVGSGSLLAPSQAQSMCGDCGPVDGATNILDALTAAQHSAGLLTLTGTRLAAGDVTPRTGGGACDGAVSILDALLIAQFAAGLQPTLDCCIGPPPGSPTGLIRSPNSGTLRGDIPIRMAARDPEFQPLSIQTEFSTDGGTTWSLATMSEFVTFYSASALSYLGDFDGASYRMVNYSGGSGSFQVGELVTGSVSGATAAVFKVLTPGSRLILAWASGTMQECETITGATSGATGVIDGMACGGGTGFGLYSRQSIMGSPLFDVPVPASTANPVLNVFPGETLVFVWDSATDIPGGPAGVTVRAVLSDGTLSTHVISGAFTVDNAPVGTDHLLLTEMSITGGEFVEIHNPTAAPIDLTDYYLTDATQSSTGRYYYNLASGMGPPGGGSISDWFARFPPGSTIAPGQYIVVAGSDDQFWPSFGVHADYQLCDTSCLGGSIVPCMLPVGGGIQYSATCGAMGTTSALTDTGEVVILFKWDGIIGSLVQDVDYILWGDKVEGVSKTGVLTYLPDTAIANQSTIPPSLLDGDLHHRSFTASRIDLEEGAEIDAGGNGITGHDETSEDLENTWVFTGIPTPARKNFAMPPQDDRFQAGDFIINEVCYDPNADTNGDGVFAAFEDSFVEFVNVSGAPIDVSMWRVHNVATVFGLSHEFPPGTIVNPNQAVVVWGGGAPMGNPCGRLNQLVSDGSWFFNIGAMCDSSDGIVLINGGRLMDKHFDCFNSINASFTRDPDLTGPFVNHTTAATAAGAAFSPGCRQDGSGF